MIPLIDADCLLYHIGFAADRAEEAPIHFDRVAEMLDRQVQYICNQISSEYPPILFLTGKGNFRNEIAETKPYKQRAGNRPYHYQNLKSYIKGKYYYRLQDGLEADDLLAIEQTKQKGEGCICTLDKDLRQVPGYYYTWEVGNRPAFGPDKISELGRISDPSNKVKGCGLLFFLEQMIVGDPVDSIPGIPKAGPIKAYEALKGCRSYKEGLGIVFNLYLEFVIKNYEGSASELRTRAYQRMLEQGQLLWITRELRHDGKPILWGFELERV